MKALSLGLAFVLVACASASTNDAESGSAAVSAAPDVCSTLAAQDPTGSIDITGGESGIAQFEDLEAEDSDTVQADGSHLYTFTLLFTSTPNECAYRNAGAALASHTSFGFSASRTSSAALDNPFPAGSYDGVAVETKAGTCDAAGAREEDGPAMPSGASNNITITSRTDSAVQGTIELRSEDGSQVLFAGKFNAPLCHPKTLSPAAKAICCQ